MCGRVTLRRFDITQAVFRALNKQQSYEEFDEKKLEPKWSAKPRYNIAPSQTMTIIRLDNGERVIESVTWGFVPSWGDDNSKIKPINAKSETVATSGMFRQAFKSARCLVIVDGFYEWKAGTPKQPHFFHRLNHELFAFAGLYSVRPNGNTCVVLTTTPNDITSPVHNRMPVILLGADEDRWLNPNTPPDELQALLRPCPNDVLVCDPVSQRVNKPANDDPKCIEPDSGLWPVA